MVFSLISLILTLPLQTVAQTDGFPSNIIASTNTNTEPHSLPLKATQGTSGQIVKVDGFKLDLTNVISTQINSQLTLFTSETVEKAKIKTASNSFIDLQKTGFNTFSLVNLPQGVYTLDIIVDGGNIKGAYEGILVIGQVPQDLIQKEITKTVTDIDVRITFGTSIPQDKDVVCLYNPAHPLCKPDENGKCSPGWGRNDDGQCFPMNKKCPPGYWRADNDETGACVPRGEQEPPQDEELPPCDGSFQDCKTESGFVCEAGSTDDNCELDEEESADEEESVEDSGGEDSGGEDSGGEDSGGEDSGGEDSGGEDSGGEDSGGEDSGGEDSGGEDSGGEDSGSVDFGSDGPVD